MKKRILAILLALCAMVGFCACEEAAEPVGINNIELNENGELIITLSNGENKNLGVVVRDKGDTGATGATGAQGPQGEKGDDGVGILKAEIIDGCLWITYSNAPNAPVNVGKVVAEEPEGTEGLEFYFLPDGTYGVMAGSALYLEEIVIPSTYKEKTVSAILPNAFKNSINLKSVLIPESITRIDESAFNNCNELRAVYYGGNESSWNLMEGSTALFVGENIYFYAENHPQEEWHRQWYYADGVPTVWHNSTNECLVCGTLSAYELIYVSNGDGTCYVSEIQIAPHRTSEFSIQIPNTSPTGETVTAIKCSPFSPLVPQILSAKDFDEILVKMQKKRDAGELSDFYYDKFCTCFTLQALSEKPTEAAKTQLLEKYPITAITDIRVFVTSATDEEMWWVSSMLCHYADYRPGIMIDDYTYLYRLANAAENKTEILKSLPDLQVSLGTLITSIDYPSGIEEVNFDWLLSCQNLQNVVIPKNVTEIPDSTFSNYKSLTSVTISDGVTSIGDSAFDGCNNLTSITIPNSVKSIGEYAFRGCSNLETITVQAGNTTYHTNGNCLIETASKTLVVGCKNSIIPTDGSVTSIGDYAFYGCSNLTSITIPDSVTSIGYSAFRGCSGLTSITIPDSVTSIGDSAFCGCSGLTSIMIPDNLTSIGGFAFYGCSNLTSVYYGGTETEWENISLGGVLAKPDSSATYYYSETQPEMTGNYWHYVDGVPTKW